MKYELTTFKNRFDNRTNKRTSFNTWDKFEALLYKLSTMPMESKEKAPLISPAVYDNGGTRKNMNVSGWAGWAAVDVDDHQFEGDLENELRDRYGNWYYVCYSTASSTNDHPKFRLVFPLKSAIRCDRDDGGRRIKNFWYALNEELGSIGDGQTKDLSRMYYIPATYANANNFIFTNSGQFIDPDALIAKHPNSFKERAASFIDRLPVDIQQEILEFRKSKMDNTSITWSGYKDCPFVNKKQVNDYRSITASGWYAQMYKIMVTIACNAVKQKYPITAFEIEELVREIDGETGNWYSNRPINAEANNALEYAYRNAT